MKASANWKLFWSDFDLFKNRNISDIFSYQFGQNHTRADLIWNEKTREEFRQAIDNEMRQLQQELEFIQPGTTISWNHAEFLVIFIFNFLNNSQI